MKEALRQTLSQKMQQRLSPLQMRFVRMLEMTGPEMEEEVSRELDDNPALAEADHTDAQESTDQTFGETAEEMQMADYKDEEEIPFYRMEARNHSVNDQWFEPVAVDGSESLMDILTSQLAETDITPQELSIAKYIIGNLDSNGYMTRSLAEIEDDLAFGAGIEVDSRTLRVIFDRIRSLDPAGVGAMDLRDCLLLQLKRMPDSQENRLAREIVEHYFDIFSLRHFEKLVSLTGSTRQQLRDAEDVIRSLNPKPAALIGESEADDRIRHIIPDFTVETDENGTFTVSMPNNIPELAIESSFAAGSGIETSDSVNGRKDALAFIEKKRMDANDFIELLRLRRETLMKVMEAIVRLQDRFFVTEDESTLRPMILKDVAQLTGSDLSVISRATAGKYVATQGGTYPLKFFFNERVGDDDNTSSHEILAAIRDIVAQEDPHSPLNDDALVSILHDRGYEIARRTVAKYREKLNIPVARLRKKI